MVAHFTTETIKRTKQSHLSLIGHWVSITSRAGDRRGLSVWQGHLLPGPAGGCLPSAWLGAVGARSKAPHSRGTTWADGRDVSSVKGVWGRGIDFHLSWKPSAWGAGRLIRARLGQSQLSERFWRGFGAGGPGGTRSKALEDDTDSVSCFVLFYECLMHFRLYDCLLPWQKIQWNSSIAYLQ